MLKVVRSFYCPEELMEEMNVYLAKVSVVLGRTVSRNEFIEDSVGSFFTYLEGLPDFKVKEILGEELPYERGQSHPPIPFKIPKDLDLTIKEVLTSVFGLNKKHIASKSAFYVRACRFNLKRLKDQATEKELRRVMEERGESPIK